MRRKLIKQDAFEQIANSSVTAAERELSEAASVLTKVLGKDHLSLHSFTESTVMYETQDDTYVHAGFELKNGNVTLTNVEELVVDHDSKKNKMKSILGEMVEALLVDDTKKADGFFESYMNMVSFNEAKKEKKENPFFAKKKDKGDKKAFGKKADKKDNEAFGKKLKLAGKKVEEAYGVAKNVLDYVDIINLGPALAEAVTKTDDNGNVLDVRIPGSKARNEGKILSFDWKTLNHKVKVLREQALGLHNDENFCKAMSDLRKQNALSNAQGMENVIENIVRAWPYVLYTTHAELAQIIGEALNFAGVSNYDDKTCGFLAEGILRTAHKSYPERVTQLLHLASAPKCETNVDEFDHFKSVIEDFFPVVDEKFGLERKAFSDLYESLEGLYQTADRRGDEALKQATAGYLNELAAVLNNEAKPDIELAEEAATWLKNFIEASIEGGVWTVSNKSHTTLNGDHPDMAKKATEDGTPGKHLGGWGDEAPMIGQDDMSYKGGKHSKEARNKSWGNKGGKDTYPSLDNPYVPKPFGDYTMKGEKGVDKDTFGQHHSTWQSKDTWPKLQNPYVPKGETAKTYKMNKGKEKDLVVDK